VWKNLQPFFFVCAEVKRAVPFLKRAVPFLKRAVPFLKRGLFFCELCENEPKKVTMSLCPFFLTSKMQTTKSGRAQNAPSTKTQKR
jgi:hypothetical protein